MRQAIKAAQYLNSQQGEVNKAKIKIILRLITIQ